MLLFPDTRNDRRQALSKLLDFRPFRP
jgi:hypothetical protein